VFNVFLIPEALNCGAKEKYFQISCLSARKYCYLNFPVEAVNKNLRFSPANPCMFFDWRVMVPHISKQHLLSCPSKLFLICIRSNDEIESFFFTGTIIRGTIFKNTTYYVDFIM